MRRRSPAGLTAPPWKVEGRAALARTRPGVCAVSTAVGWRASGCPSFCNRPVIEGRKGASSIFFLAAGPVGRAAGGGQRVDPLARGLRGTARPGSPAQLTSSSASGPERAMAVVSCESRHRPPGPRPSSAGGPLPPRRPTWPSATNRSPARLCRPAYFRALAGPGPPPSTLAEQPSKLSVRLAAGGGQETDWTARCPSSRGSPPSLALAPPAALPHLTPRLPPSCG